MRLLDEALKEHRYFDAWMIVIIVSFTAFIVMLAVGLLLMPRPIVECDTDLDCHEKNPGVCKADEPYCL